MTLGENPNSDDLYDINANIVKTLVEAVADNCPDAFIHIISNPVKSTVPIATEVLKPKGVYDPKKLLGVTTLDVVRANTFVAQKKNLKLIDVDVPVVGGHAGITILPLMSKTKPSLVSFTDEEMLWIFSTPEFQFCRSPESFSFPYALQVLLRQRILGGGGYTKCCRLLLLFGSM